MKRRQEDRDLRNITIRPMAVEEAVATAEMWQRSMRDAYTWMRPDQLHPLAEAIEFFRTSICRRCEIWVAALNDEASRA